VYILVGGLINQPSHWKYAGVAMFETTCVHRGDEIRSMVRDDEKGTHTVLVLHDDR
jgi:hypothetical protein